MWDSKGRRHHRSLVSGAGRSAWIAFFAFSWVFTQRLRMKAALDLPNQLPWRQLLRYLTSRNKSECQHQEVCCYILRSLEKLGLFRWSGNEVSCSCCSVLVMRVGQGQEHVWRAADLQAPATPTTWPSHPTHKHSWEGQCNKWRH